MGFPEFICSSYRTPPVGRGLVSLLTTSLAISSGDEGRIDVIIGLREKGHHQTVIINRVGPDLPVRGALCGGRASSALGTSPEPR